MAGRKRKLEKVDHIIKVTLLTTQVINLTSPFYASASGKIEQDQANQSYSDRALTVTDSTYDLPHDIPQTFYMMSSDPMELLQTLPHGSGVSLTPLLSLLFDQELRLGTGEITVYRLSDDQVVERLSGGNVRLSGSVAMISLTRPLADDTSYYVQVSSGMFQDGAGQGFGGIYGPGSWSFRTVDQTAPQMVSKSPEGSGAMLVSGLSMTFNEPMQWGTGDVIVHEALDGRIARQVHVSGGSFTTGYGTLNGDRADLYLDGGLEEGTSYYVEVTPGTLTDRSGNPFAGILGSSEWTFRTGDEAPYYTSLWPHNSGASLQPELTILFSEAIRLGSGEITVNRKSDNQVVERLSGGNVRLSGSVAMISLNGPLADDTSYYVQVSSGMFRDGAGQGFGGIYGPGSWSFRTVDQTAPQMVSKSPEGSGAMLVSGLSMTFNEPVKWGTGDVIVYGALDGRIARQVHVSGGRFIAGYGTLNGDRADLYLDGGLESGTSYYVEVTPGTLMDHSGNPFAGILGSSEWTFRTGDEAPYYTDLWPKNSGASLQPELTILFSEAIRLGTGEITVYRQSDNQVVERLSGGNVRLSGSVAMISLTRPLADDTSYYVQVSSGMFRDGAGQGFGGIYGPGSWSFRTVDQTAPQMVSKSPEGSGAMLVSGLSMTFNEPVKWGTGDVIVYGALDGRIARQVHVSGGRFTTGYGTLNGNRADLYLDGGLKNGTSYYVEVTPGTLMDHSGNPFAGIQGSSGWTFRTLPQTPSKVSDRTRNSGSVTPTSVPSLTAQGGILVNAKKTTTITEAGERTTLDIKEDDLTKELHKNKLLLNESQTLMIDAAQYGSNIIVNLPMSSFRISEALGNLRIGFGSSEAQYFLPAELIQQWAETYNDDTLSIQITKLENETKSLIQGMVVNEKAVQAEPGPTEFLVRAGQREISDFSNKYVERKLLLRETVSAKNSTAVWMNPETNRLHFVPSLFENEDGATEVTIKTAHNSIYTVISADKKFSDMNGHWAYDDVELMANKLILQGVTPEKFDPNRPITRSEFVALIVRGLGLQEDSESEPFSDVTANDWHAGSIGAAIKAGLVQGNENSEFLPNAPITREEIALIAEKALEYVKGTGEREGSNAPYLPAYKDEGTVSLWAKSAMNQAINQGLIQGKSTDTLAPKEHATRAEAASVIKRLLRLLKFID